MKEMQLKIRKFLFIALVAILGVLLLLYIAFCRGGDYNSAHIDEPTTKVESTTEAPTVPDEETTEIDNGFDPIGGFQNDRNWF